MNLLGLIFHIDRGVNKHQRNIQAVLTFITLNRILHEFFASGIPENSKLLS